MVTAVSKKAKYRSVKASRPITIVFNGRKEASVAASTLIFCKIDFAVWFDENECKISGRPEHKRFLLNLKEILDKNESNHLVIVRILQERGLV